MIEKNNVNGVQLAMGASLERDRERSIQLLAKELEAYIDNMISLRFDEEYLVRVNDIGSDLYASKMEVAKKIQAMYSAGGWDACIESRRGLDETKPNSNERYIVIRYQK